MKRTLLLYCIVAVALLVFAIPHVTAKEDSDEKKHRELPPFFGTLIEVLAGFVAALGNFLWSLWSSFTCFFFGFFCPAPVTTTTTTSTVSPGACPFGTCELLGECIPLDTSGSGELEDFQLDWEVSVDQICEEEFNEALLEKAFVDFFVSALGEGSCGSNLNVTWAHIRFFDKTDCFSRRRRNQEGLDPEEINKERRLQSLGLRGSVGGTCESGDCPMPSSEEFTASLMRRQLSLSVDKKAMPRLSPSNEGFTVGRSLNTPCEFPCVDPGSLLCSFQTNGYCSTNLTSNLILTVQNCTAASASCTEGRCCGVNDCPCTLDSDFSEGLCVANNCDLVSSCTPVFNTTRPLSLCCFQSDGEYLFGQCAESAACTCIADDDPCSDQASCSNLEVCGVVEDNDETCPICNSLIDVEPSNTNNKFRFDFTVDFDDRVCESSNVDKFFTKFEKTLNRYLQFIYRVCGECNDRILIDWVNLNRDTCADTTDRRRLMGDNGGSSGTCTNCNTQSNLDNDADRRRRLLNGINRNSKVRTLSNLQALGGAQNLTFPIELCDDFGDLLDFFLRDDGFNTNGLSRSFTGTAVDCAEGSASCRNGDCCGVDNCLCTAIADPSESQCQSSDCDLASPCSLVGERPFALCCVDDDEGLPLYSVCETTMACQCVRNDCEPSAVCSAFDVCNEQSLPTCDGACNNFVNVQNSTETEFQFSFEFALFDLESCKEEKIEFLLLSYFQFWINSCAECGNDIVPNWLRINNMVDCTTSTFLVRGDVGGKCVGECFIPGLPILSSDFVTRRGLGESSSFSSIPSSSSVVPLADEHQRHRHLLNFNNISVLLCFDLPKLFEAIADLNNFQANATTSPVTLTKDCATGSTECADGSCSYTNGCNVLQGSAGVSKSLCDFNQCDVDLGYYVEGDRFVNLCCEYKRIDSEAAVYPSCGGVSSGDATPVCQCWRDYFVGSVLDDANICECDLGGSPCCGLGFTSCDGFPCATCLQTIFSPIGNGI